MHILTCILPRDVFGERQLDGAAAGGKYEGREPRVAKGAWGPKYGGKLVSLLG